jgi:hypothetical protein
VPAYLGGPSRDCLFNQDSFNRGTSPQRGIRRFMPGANTDPRPCQDVAGRDVTLDSCWSSVSLKCERGRSKQGRFGEQGLRSTQFVASGGATLRAHGVTLDRGEAKASALASTVRKIRCFVRAREVRPRHVRA